MLPLVNYGLIVAIREAAANQKLILYWEIPEVVSIEWPQNSILPLTHVERIWRNGSGLYLSKISYFDVKCLPLSIAIRRYVSDPDLGGWYCAATGFFINCKAPVEHVVTQRPQPMQRSRLIVAT